MTTHQDTNTERNCRVQERYDELMQAGKHGHYESMFRVVREEVDAALSSRDEAAQQPQGPSAEDVRELSKWLNEEVSAPINRQALARVLAVQQPQGQAVSDERVEELAAQFDISVSAVRAILSLRDKSVVKESLTTERVPLSDEQIESLLVNWPKDGIAFIDFARAIEAAHGITEPGAGGEST